VREPIYSRAPDVVWRLGPDRVLVRRVRVPERQPRELQGAAALVWLTLDEPATQCQVVERLGAAGVEVEPEGGVRLLLEERLIVDAPAI
jgi:hypothetical protein